MKAARLLPGLFAVLCSCSDSGVSSPPEITIATDELPSGAVAAPYTASLVATGGTGSHGWSLASGSLPAGLELSVNGTITGTPTTAGTSSFTVQAVSGGESATRGFAITIMPPDVAITTGSLPAGTAGQLYSQTLTAAGGTGSYAWSVANGTLPSGLSLSGTGLISGTPTAPGSTTFTVQATSGGRTATRDLTLAIDAPTLAVSSEVLPDAIVGVPYSESLAASGGSGGYTWSLAAGALPAGLTLSAAGAVSGTPTAAGASSFTAAVTSGTEQATRALTITVHSPSVAITTTSLPAAVAGQPYSQALVAVGGVGTYTWTLAGGALPGGLTLSPGGVISGTPGEAGTSSFTVRVASGGQTASLALTLAVQVPPVVITTGELPAAVLGTAYQQQLTATGGTGAFTWSLIAGSLPAGLTLSPTGLLTGQPTALGATTFTVRALSAGVSATRELTLVVGAPPVVIATGALPAGRVGQPYTHTFAATGGTGAYQWTLASGTLPAGLTLSATGVLSGTPTAAGTASFAVRATSGGQQATANVTLTVAAAVPDVTISTATLPAATVGAPYTYTLTASGGTGSYAWALDPASAPLPPGLALSAAGVLSGTPTTAGTSSFVVRVVSGERQDTASLTLTVNAATPDVVITTSTLPGATVGTAYQQTLTASGGAGTYLWSVSSGTLPAGVQLSAEGVLSGTPTTAGTATFTVTATSGGDSDSRQLSLTVAPAPVEVTTTTLPAGLAGTAYSQQLAAAGGSGSYTWSLLSGALPTGLNLYADGTIAGTPTVAGTSTFTVQAASDGLSGSRELAITILAPVSITTATLPAAQVGEPYSQALAATGGDGTYEWTLVDGSLPTGLTLSAQGAIAGTPTTAGASSFTVQATSAGSSDTQILEVAVSQAGGDALVITTTTLPEGNRNVPYTATLSATGGTGTYAWSLIEGALQPGLTLSSDGVISGTPTSPGNQTFTVSVSSGAQTTTQVLSLRIRP